MSTTNVRNAQLHAELDAIAAEFGLAIPSEAGTPLAALDVAIAGTEFAGASQADSPGLAALDTEGDPVVEEMFLGIIRDRARKLIERLIGLARKYRNCPKCIGHVTAAVAAFKTGRFPAAIVAAVKAIGCFRGCAS